MTLTICQISVTVFLLQVQVVTLSGREKLQIRVVKNHVSLALEIDNSMTIHRENLDAEYQKYFQNQFCLELYTHKVNGDKICVYSQNERAFHSISLMSFLI